MVAVHNHGWPAKRAISGGLAVERRVIAHHIATTMWECFNEVAMERLQYLENGELVRKWKLENGVTVTFDDLIPSV